VDGAIQSAAGAQLRSCHPRALQVADDLGSRTVAFPLVSAGAYGWPLDDAARQAVTALRAATTRTIVDARLVAFSPAALEAVQRALERA